MAYTIHWVMMMQRIDNIDQWRALAAELCEDGYAIWQMQYSASQPEGFHAWFWAEGRADIEVVTHSREVEKAMVKYKAK